MGLGAPSSVPTGNSPRAVATGDFNGDRVTDLATANLFSDDVTVLLGIGDGTFGSAASFGVGIFPRSVIAKDFNSDGIAGLAIANSDSNSVSVLLNQCSADSIILGDVNEDGVVDLLDVEPFIAVLGSGKYQVEADCNEDGAVNLLDVDRFVSLLGE